MVYGLNQCLNNLGIDFQLILLTSFTQAWSRSFDFKGLTTRKDYWYFILSNTLFGIALNILLGLSSLFRKLVASSSWDLPWILSVSFGTISWVIGISAILHYFGSILVNLTVTIRRLRDAGKNWVWVLVPLWNLYLCTKPTKQLVTTNFSD